MKTTAKQNILIAASIALAFTLPSFMGEIGDFVHQQYAKLVLKHPDKMLTYSREMTSGFQSLMRKAVDGGFQYADLPGFKANFIECTEKDENPLHVTQISSENIAVKIYCTLPVEKLALIRQDDGAILVYTTQEERAITNGDAYTDGEQLYMNHFSAYNKHFFTDEEGKPLGNNDVNKVGQLGFK
jgi:hypothetical protein